MAMLEATNDPARFDDADRHLPTGDDFLDPAEVARLTPEALTRRTRALAPLIAGNAAEAERLRRPVPEVWSAIRATGFFYQYVPRSFGGLGFDTDAFVDAALPIARACPSTGWVACFCAGHNRTLAHFPAAAQAELWGGAFPYITAPSLSPPPGRAVPVAGGYSVTGRWSWASGIMDADWVMAIATVADDPGGPPQMLFALIPAADVDVLDTWHVDGLCGTGSNDVQVADLFVPEHRVLRDMGAIGGRSSEGCRHPEPIFQAPMPAFACFNAAVPVVGAAQGALDHFRARLAGRVEKGTNAKSADSPLKHARLAEADLAIGAAETLVRQAGRQLVEAAGLEGAAQVRLRIAIRAGTTYAVKLCRDAVLRLAEGAGSSAHRSSDPFQRHVRDIGIMASHVGFDVDQAYELHGRSLLGLEPNSMLY